ncbi:MAG: HlyC/CorC family transporter [Desulfitobacterium sp.]|nr:HlyC/CorC family transporter [Desulfitobacterium sp.]
MVLAVLLVGLNAFFVGAEFSLVKVRKTRLAELAELGGRKADVAIDVTNHLDTYLSACQLGITLASLGLGWLGESAIAGLIAPLFKNIVGWDGVLTHTVSLIIAFLLIVFMHIVLGELVPKSIAIRSAERAALWTAGPLRVFYRIFFPVIHFFNWIANWILKLWGISPANEADLAYTEEELRMLVDASQRHGILGKLEGKLLDNVFEFSELVVSEVMVPRQDMVCLYIQDSIEEVLETVKKAGHTRYPLCDDDKDNVIGLIHMRDLLGLPENPQNIEIADLKREILIVPEGMPISHLVQKMRNQRTHLSVIVDEFGGTAGMVTIEDLIEQLVGEIYDEFEGSVQAEIIESSEGEYIINGRVLLDDLEELLEIEIHDDTISTVGGLVFNHLGRKPAKGDSIEFEGYVFTVMEVVGFRITQVKVAKIEEPSEELLQVPEKSFV